MSSGLKQARIEAGYSIDDIARYLNIRTQYLIALEEGNLDMLPSKVYAKGYLKLYMEYLGLPVPIKTDNIKKQETLQYKISPRLQKYIVILSIFMLLVTFVVYHLLLYKNI